MTTKTIDLGCGSDPKNPFNMDEVYGIDFKENKSKNIYKADLAIQPIPFEDNYFDGVTAHDLIEHIPRIIYNPNCRFAFVELMNEIYRVLKPDGLFLSRTPAYPAPELFQDPTHVNFITEDTFEGYFCFPYLTAQMYGFVGKFEFVHQEWVVGTHKPTKTHLTTVLRKK